MPKLHGAWLWLVPAALLIGCQGARPMNLDARDGKLAPCPSTPNCVSSQAADEEHRVAPLTLNGPADAAIARLTEIVHALPRTRIITHRGGYLHVEFTSAIFRFVDDVEFLVDGPAGLIHVRSASRIGKYDLGANRRRIERIRDRWDQHARR